MSEASALRPGQKVTLTGEVLVCLRPGIDVALDCGDDDRWIAYNVPLSALTPVVEPEPTFTPGDVVRIDGVSYMLTDVPYSPTSMGPIWICSERDKPNIYPHDFSEHWGHGCVVVVYRKEADK